MDNNIETKNIKVTRVLPKSWRNRIFGEKVFGDVEFATYCKKLYTSLLGIKKYYKSDFNKDNTHPIDEYIDLFNDLYDKFLNLSISNNQINKYFEECKKKEIDVDLNGRFDIFENLLQRNKDIYKTNAKNETTGFTENGYNQVKKIAKQMFVMEKLCAFTTRKFWKNELTNIDKLNLKSKFKILVKCVMRDEWRQDHKSKDEQEFLNDRIYCSASLIDENSKEKLFALTSIDTFAIMIMDCDEKDIICASNKDSYSEEHIDNQNLIKDKKEFTKILLQDNIAINGKNHKLFAEAVECETPKNILKNIKRYSEVNLRSAKPIGIICPNLQSEKFCQKQAKKLNLPLYSFEK